MRWLQNDNEYKILIKNHYSVCPILTNMNAICDSLRKISTTIDQKNFKDKLMLRMNESHLLIFEVTNFSILYSVIYMLTVKYVVKINVT